MRVEEKLLRLAEARIEVVPSGLANHFILTRDASKALAKAARRNSIPLISLP